MVLGGTDTETLLSDDTEFRRILTELVLAEMKTLTLIRMIHRQFC